MASRTTYTLAAINGRVVQNAPSGVKQAILAIRVWTPSYMKMPTPCIKDLVLADNHILTLKNWFYTRTLVILSFLTLCVRSHAITLNRRNLLFVNKNNYLCSLPLFNAHSRYSCMIRCHNCTSTKFCSVCMMPWDTRASPKW